MPPETTPSPEATSTLDSAPDHIKLAVDLIELLENNGIDNLTAQQALQIVLKDVQAKLAAESPVKPAP